eukprot:3924227-Rhodomonas_salina.1
MAASEVSERHPRSSGSRSVRAGRWVGAQNAGTAKSRSLCCWCVTCFSHTSLRCRQCCARCRTPRQVVCEWVRRSTSGWCACEREREMLLAVSVSVSVCAWRAGREVSGWRCFRL